MSASLFKKKISRIRTKPLYYGVLGALYIGIFVLIIGISYTKHYAIKYDANSVVVDAHSPKSDVQNVEIPPFNKETYDNLMLKLANHRTVASTSTSTQATTTPIKNYLWPTKAVYPKSGALLPYNRIIAYYGNFYSKGMGVLGQYPKDEMLSKLKGEIEIWNKADPKTPALPAIDYIVSTAQMSPGKQGLYMLRMPDTEIDHAVEIAREVKGIVILDVQVGLSNLQKELPLLQKYLMMPDVHLALDPEFSMKTGARPGTVVGTYDAADINYAAEYLAKIVKDNNLPPKILIVHRFTQNMVTHATSIKPLPEVEIVMDMDGWGSPAKKINTYKTMIYPEPVQFTGFKLFYKNDLKAPSTRLLTPEDLLQLEPRPIFIQYQ